MRIQVFIGTRKGAFIASSHGDRKEWSLAGPIFKGWEVTAVDRLADGTWLVGTTSYVYGPAIHRSRDLDRWEQVVDGPAFSPDSGRTLKSIWTLTSGHGQVWAGVDEAALFRSSDQGRSWLPVPGLNDHPSRDGWQPGAGGLCAHAVLLDPEDEGQIWCGISAVGVFHSQDSGKSWTPANRGVTQIIESPGHPGIGYCVHGLAQDVSDPQRIWRQDHTGMYRSSDGGRDWERAEGGLPSGFGFPIARDPHSGRLFVVPLESDEYRLPLEGRLKVYVSDDDGETWEPREDGLPQTHHYHGVLRGGMAIDGLDPCGVYLGTTGGTVHLSSDGGESWLSPSWTLPRIHCVGAFVSA